MNEQNFTTPVTETGDVIQITDTQGAELLVRAFKALAEAASGAMLPGALPRTHAAFDKILDEFGFLPGIHQIYGAVMACAMVTDNPLTSSGKQHLEESFVYFIRRNDGAIKIGASSNVPQRLATLRGIVGANIQLLATIPGGTKKEFELHKVFERYRIEGEWFSPGIDLLAYIESPAISERIQPSLLN